MRCIKSEGSLRIRGTFLELRNRAHGALRSRWRGGEGGGKSSELSSSEQKAGLLGNWILRAEKRELFSLQNEREQGKVLGGVIKPVRKGKQSCFDRSQGTPGSNSEYTLSFSE